jgi:hypothetical protein
MISRILVACRPISLGTSVRGVLAPVLAPVAAVLAPVAAVLAPVAAVPAPGPSRAAAEACPSEGVRGKSNINPCRR